MEDDETYFRRRAEQALALALAERAVDPCVVNAHYRLAEAYLERVAHLEWDDAVDTATPEKSLFAFGAATAD